MFVCAQRDPASEFAQRHRREECTAVFACCNRLWPSGTEVWRSSVFPTGATLQLVTKACENYRQCSGNSRMEALYIRDEMLKLQEAVRFLEDEISKGDKKLVRFPDFCLNAADRSAILLQAVSVQARECLVLHGKTGSWNEMAESLRFYGEQLRMVELPGGGLRGLKGEKGKGDAKGKKGSKNSGSGADSPRWLVGTVARQGTTKKSAARDLQTRRRKGKGTASTKEKTRAKARVQRTTRTTSLRQRAKASVAKERARTRSSKRALWLRVKRRKSLKVRR